MQSAASMAKVAIRIFMRSSGKVAGDRAVGGQAAALGPSSAFQARSMVPPCRGNSSGVVARRAWAPPSSRVPGRAQGRRDGKLVETDFRGGWMPRGGHSARGWIEEAPNHLSCRGQAAEDYVRRGAAWRGEGMVSASGVVEAMPGPALGRRKGSVSATPGVGGPSNKSGLDRIWKSLAF